MTDQAPKSQFSIKKATEFSGNHKQFLGSSWGLSKARRASRISRPIVRSEAPATTAKRASRSRKVRFSLLCFLYLISAYFLAESPYQMVFLVISLWNKTQSLCKDWSLSPFGPVVRTIKKAYELGRIKKPLRWCCKITTDWIWTQIVELHGAICSFSWKSWTIQATFWKGNLVPDLPRLWFSLSLKVSDYKIL